MRNGYFQLVKAGNGYGLKIVAPTDGGETVRMSEVMDYLMRRNQVYDLAVLKKEIEKGETTIMLLGSGECPKENAVTFISFSQDYMQATLRVHPASETALPLTTKEIISDLNYRKIIFGINVEAIEECIEEKIYCTDIVVAEGKKPRHGTDASIEYFFNTDLRIRPTQNEDGSVDFFNLNTINTCHAGDVLAKLIPADEGEFGMNILGAKIKPRDVKRTHLKYGHNIDISEDKMTLTSKVDGHVMLVEEKVFVSDILTVENVDNSTGNINYEGSVQINGNVQSNFQVCAKGNVVVNGLVEGAYIQSGGDIVIARGMNGMGKGVLKAEGNIIVKFLENASASAGGYINTEASVHCNLMAGDSVTVDGRRGFITGGKVSATNFVKVKTLGSAMGASTIIEVGGNPEMKQRYVLMQKELSELAKDLASMEPMIITYLQKKKQGMQLNLQQMQYLKTLLDSREEKKARQVTIEAEMELRQLVLERQDRAQVIITGEVFSGVKIAIGDLSMIVPSNMKYCKFVKMAGDVKMVSI